MVGERCLTTLQLGQPAWVAEAPEPDTLPAERGLRGLVGGGSSQVSPTAALRARDAARIAPLLASLAAGTGRDARQSRVRVWERERATEAFLAALAAKKKLIYEIISGTDIQDMLGERFQGLLAVGIGVVMAAG